MVESPASFDRVTCLPPKNASAPWGGVGSRWLTIIVWQVSYVQYLLACQKLQRSTPYNIVKNGLPWKRVFRRRHLGRQVTAVTCLRWPTVIKIHLIGNACNCPVSTRVWQTAALLTAKGWSEWRLVLGRGHCRKRLRNTNPHTIQWFSGE